MTKTKDLLQTRSALLELEVHIRKGCIAGKQQKVFLKFFHDPCTSKKYDQFRLNDPQFGTKDHIQIAGATFYPAGGIRSVDVWGCAVGIRSFLPSA